MLIYHDQVYFTFVWVIAATHPCLFWPSNCACILALSEINSACGSNSRKYGTCTTYIIMQRLEIFRQQVIEEKERLGIKTSRSARQPATYVTVHRARILDDGYAQLSLLHMKALKGTIRVKFVNEQVHVHVYDTYY